MDVTQIVLGETQVKHGNLIGTVVKKQGNDFVARTNDGRLFGFNEYSPVEILDRSISESESTDARINGDSTGTDDPETTTSGEGTGESSSGTPDGAGSNEPEGTTSNEPSTEEATLPPPIT